jgi:hypothetical protein
MPIMLPIWPPPPRSFSSVSDEQQRHSRVVAQPYRVYGPSLCAPISSLNLGSLS